MPDKQNHRENYDRIANFIVKYYKILGQEQIDILLEEGDSIQSIKLIQKKYFLSGNDKKPTKLMRLQKEIYDIYQEVVHL